MGALVGIDGVVAKVQGLFQALQKPATAAITALFERIKAAIAGLLAKLGIGKKGEKEKPEEEAGPLTPDKARDLIVAELEKPAKADDAAGAIAETKAQAEALKARFQPRLEKGTIRITVTNTTPEAVEKDGDVDIVVALSPGTKVAKRVRKKIPDEVTPLVRIEFKYHSGLRLNPTAADRAAGFTRDGFQGQLAGQERGLNAMKAGEWRTNRDRFLALKEETGSGRDPIAAALQEEFREKQREALVDALQEPKGRACLTGLVPSSRAFVQSRAKADGMSESVAESLVDAFLETQAALHDPDQIAGGHPSGLKDLGNRPINSSIGSQWRTRAEELDEGIGNALKVVPRPLWNKIPMKVTNKGGVRLVAK